MSRRLATIPASIATAFALLASGAVLADDNSMSVWTGDSYAYFNDLDYHPGSFNTAQAAAMPKEARAETAVGPRDGKQHQPMMSAQRPHRTMPRNAFRDDTGA